MSEYVLVPYDTPADLNCNPVRTHQPGFLVRTLGSLGTMVSSSLFGKCITQAGTATKFGIACRVVESGVKAGAVQTACGVKLVTAIPIIGEKVRASLLSSVATGQLSAVAKQSLLDSARSLGLGSVVGFTATFVIRQGTNTVWMLRGSISPETYAKKTVKNTCSSIAGVGGSAAGAVIGSIVYPGVGTALGSIIGAIVLPYLTEKCARGVLHIDEAYAPSAKLTPEDLPAVSGGWQGAAGASDDGWDAVEVIDANTWERVSPHMPFEVVVSFEGAPLKEGRCSSVNFPMDDKLSGNYPANAYASTAHFPNVS